LALLHLGWLKINFDVETRPSNSLLATIYQDHVGKFIHALTNSDVIEDLLWAETLQF